MDESIYGIVIIIVISAASATWFHFVIRPFMPASVVAALVSTVLLQVVSYVELGHLDKLWPIAVVGFACYAFVISIPVGMVVRRFRTPRQ